MMGHFFSEFAKAGRNLKTYLCNIHSSWKKYGTRVFIICRHKVEIFLDRNKGNLTFTISILPKTNTQFHFFCKNSFFLKNDLKFTVYQQTVDEQTRKLMVIVNSNKSTKKQVIHVCFQEIFRQFMIDFY